MNPEYAHHDSAGWVERATGQKCSALGRQVAQVLGVVGQGIYNAPINHDRVAWGDEHCIEVAWRGRLANWDGPGLSLLLIECSRRMLRVDVYPCNMQHVTLMFHQRALREGGIAERLPELREIEKTVEGWYT